MKLDRIPTRRKPVKKKVYARLFNKTKPRRQRASAAAASPEDMEGAGINISRSLSIIFAIHILAIGMIFIHKQYLSGRTAVPVSSTQKAEAEVGGKAQLESPALSSGAKPYMANQGESYAAVAAKFGVDEKELRDLNRGTEIRSGVVLRIPQKKRIVAAESAEVIAVRDQQRLDQADDGLVEILPPTHGAESKVVRPANTDSSNIPKARPISSAQTHKVKAGENIWRISKEYGVGQKELMTLNKITDPTKLRVGQILQLP